MSEEDNSESMNNNDDKIANENNNALIHLSLHVSIASPAI